MLRHMLVGMVGLAITSLAGCQMGGSRERVAGPDRAQLAAHAATAQFPQEVSEEDIRVAAILNRERNGLRLINFGDEAMRNVDVWVNSAYVTRVPSIPPRGTVALRTGQFYDQTGRNLAEQDMSITRIQLQIDEQLYNAWGPAHE
jgi:hypothetical protein